MEHMRASVIIPVYNEERDIRNCLVSLAGQSLRDLEVIVVDDGSVDSTIKEASLAGRDYYGGGFRILKQKHQGPAIARNLGAGKAIGKILVFVDADMTFHEDFLAKLVKPIVDGKAKGTFSNEEYVSNWENVWARAWNVNQNWAPKRRHRRGSPDKQAVFRAILKSEFDGVDGFDKGGYTDDYSLSKKLGYEAVRVDNAKFFHTNPDTLGEVFIQAKWSGKRTYKFGVTGSALALVRASLPASFIIGMYKTIKSREPLFLPFKIIYDFGLFLGILEYTLLGKGYK